MLVCMSRTDLVYGTKGKLSRYLWCMVLLRTREMGMGSLSAFGTRHSQNKKSEAEVRPAAERSHPRPPFVRQPPSSRTC